MDLRLNALGDDTAAALPELVAACPLLSVLDLRGNDILPARREKLREECAAAAAGCLHVQV